MFAFVIAVSLLLASPASAQGGCANAALRTAASTDLPDCRALELVSPPDKVGGVGVGVWYAGPGAHGIAGNAGQDPEVERFAVSGQFGSLLYDSAFGFGSDVGLAQRTPVGWTSRSAITRGGYGDQAYRTTGVFAANPSLSMLSFGSNGGVLRIFPELESWNHTAAGQPVFLHSWDPPAWELFAPTDPSQFDNVGGGGVLSSHAISDDGSMAVGSGSVRGMAGPGDPTHPQWSTGYAIGSGNVYEIDLSGGLTDAFPAPGDRRRQLINVCTGDTDGGDRTLIPERLPVGTLAAQPCPEALPGRDAALISPLGATFFGSKTGSVSKDGSRVFFMSPSPQAASSECGPSTGPATACPPQLYVRQRGSDGSVSTSWISRSRSVAAGGGAYGGAMIAGQEASHVAAAVFEGASSDGSRVFFSTRAPLTPDDPNFGCAARQGAPLPCTSDPDGASSDSWDLYMYELPAGPDGDPATPDGAPDTGRLTRVSMGPVGEGDCNSPSGGGLRLVSTDGRRAYFACARALEGVAPGPGSTTPADGSSPSTQTNIYLFDANRSGTDRWRFVARLPRAYSGVNVCASIGQGRGESLTGNQRTAVPVSDDNNCWRGTADGSFAVFWTLGQLTGDDVDAAADVYGYDAHSDELIRISAPRGVPDDSYGCTIGDDGNELPSPRCNADLGIGGGRQSLERLNVVSDPAVAGDRVVFLQSKASLVAEDGDAAYDVYQWRNGELSLFSDWEGGPDGVQYAGSDREGRNVFLTTRDRLTWQDHDAVLDVYTARVDGGFAEPVAPVPCDPLNACGAGAPGAGTLDAAVGSDRPGGDAPARTRGVLALRRLSAAGRRRAARSGVLRVRVRVSRPSRVVATVRARFGKRSRRVGRAVKRVSSPGVVVLRVRLSEAARDRLRVRGVLRLRVGVRASGVARARSMRIVLRRAGR